MSATSSSPVSLTFPQPLDTKPKGACVDCKRLKKRCDRASPACTNCAKASRACEFKDPSEDGLFSPIYSAKSIDTLTFGTLLDILITKKRAKEAVSLYFNGVNTWFPIIEKASYEKQLDMAWDKLPAEASVLALCMALIARPPNQKSSKIGDTVYHSTKAILSLVQSKAPISVQLLQAELLVALYEFSQSMPQQAYLSLGRCLQMTKAFGWHGAEFWAEDRKAFMAKDLKLSSILWWAIVFLDCLLNVGYQDQTFPMHTAGLDAISVIPLPEHFDQHLASGSPLQFGAEEQGFRDANSDGIEGMVVPEATSAWYLSRVLQQLSDPALPGNVDSKTLSSMIWQHAQDISSAKWRAGDRNAAVCMDLIALMKLNHPGLLGGADPLSLLSDPQAVQRIRVLTTVIHGKAGKLAASEHRLSTGAEAPCWAFAMSYASLLLISHGNGVLQDADWFSRVENLMVSMEKVSKRWIIAERYCETVKIALENRLNGYAQ
ncbi:hypothetical protein C8A03DRAFT_40048 [Achaetomium macrosporum]|uniref:Zn(2)-C6 fungal-type domain-containing protein n=1 Tax=Achaetomium macrosporum TaxID=79813 RepID=A0AAN7CKH8_9PEZI|nr:hypothetical protein C8A03DRAFT_40048 [Achaetomium macrosporum]